MQCHIVPVAARRGAPLDRGALDRRLGAIQVLCALAALAGLAGILLRQADELRFPGDPIGGAVDMLMGTSWATSWWVALGAAVVLLIGATVEAAGARGGRWLAGAALMPLVAFPGLTGHANGAEARLVAVAADTIHVAAVGTWLGALAVILLIGRGRLAPLVRAFSPVAIVSVALLVATGVMASLRLIDPISAYWTTTYGRTLLLKVGLFGVVALIGLRNWRVLTPRMDEAEGTMRMVRSGGLEVLLGHAVLAVTALLVRMAPP